MSELERLSKQFGWRFVVWVIPGGSCIIQGAANDGEDWDFDISAKSFDEALSQALFAVQRLDTGAEKPG